MKILLSSVLLLMFFGCNNNSEKKNVSSEENKPAQENTSYKPEIETKNLIIPGKQLGYIILEKNAASVFDSLGKPDSGDAAMGKAISTWNKGETDLLTLYTSTQIGVEDFSRIKAVRSLSKVFKTEDNLGVSSSIEALKRYYKLDPAGKFTYNGKHYYLYTTDKGIAFEIGMDQKCSGVLLYSQGTDPETFYLPIYTDFKKL